MFQRKSVSVLSSGTAAAPGFFLYRQPGALLSGRHGVGIAVIGVQRVPFGAGK